MERVLVVEDDQGIQDLLVEALPRLGYDPVIAVNGKEGLETFRSQVFTTVITDIRMPEMDGEQLIEALRQQRERAHIPIVVVTARGPAEAGDSVGLARVHIVRSKAYTARELLQMVTAISDLLPKEPASALPAD